MTDQEVDLVISNNVHDNISTDIISTEPPPPPEEVNVTDNTQVSDQPPSQPSTSITYNATQHYPMGGVNSKDTETVSLPTDYASSVKDVLSELPNINFTDTQESREWVSVLNEGLEYVPMQEMFKDTVSAAKNGEFTQRPEYNGKPLIAASPRFDKLENNVLKGEKAVIRVLQTLGLGNLFQVPLWHTGIWVTLKPPTEAEIIELNRQLLNDKIQFGRYTYGLAFANTTSYTVDRLISFVLDHIYNTTLKTEALTADELRKLISSQDIPTLLWGLACTIYPNGFKYKRACITNPERCTHVIEETINVTKLLWTRVELLTDYQKEHMSSRQARSRTIEQVERYKDELKTIHKARVKLDNDKDIHLTIRSPSVREYIDSGYAWINSIVEAVERTISTEATQSEKDNLITRYAQASRLRQYGHWIESIEVETNISNDQETINELLDVLSSDDELFASIMSKIKAYINSSIISLIGIQSYICPACSGVQKDETYPKFTNILPLDVQQLFFGLFTQRLIRLTDR